MSTERQKVLKRACDFLAQREHSRKELRTKLSRYCNDNDLIEECLDKLSLEGLQSDKRFTESFVHYRINKGQGPLKIRQELNQRGINLDLADDCVQNCSVDWLALADEVRIKKFGQQLPVDYKDKARQSRFLQSRGFDNEHIHRLLR